MPGSGGRADTQRLELLLDRVAIQREKRVDSIRGMSDTDSLGRPEVEIFRRFVTVCPLEIEADSIEKRQPPEPDLRCKTRQGEALAFELVEIIDQDVARRIADQWTLGPKLRAAYDALPERDAAEIRARLGNAVVTVKLRDDASIRARCAEIGTILEALKKVPPAFEGAFDPRMGIVEKIYVTRGNCVGPSLDIHAGGWVGDPTVDRIRGKFAKSYEVDVPVELLAHFELHPMFPDDVWVPRVRTCVSPKLAASPFRRVWIFDVRRKSIPFFYPP